MLQTSLETWIVGGIMAGVTITALILALLEAWPVVGDVLFESKKKGL